MEESYRQEGKRFGTPASHGPREPNEGSLDAENGPVVGDRRGTHGVGGFSSKRHAAGDEGSDEVEVDLSFPAGAVCAFPSMCPWR